jgi:hypothetical protein
MAPQLWLWADMSQYNTVNIQIDALEISLCFEQMRLFCSHVFVIKSDPTYFQYYFIFILYTSVF